MGRDWSDSSAGQLEWNGSAPQPSDSEGSLRRSVSLALMGPPVRCERDRATKRDFRISALPRPSWRPPRLSSWPTGGLTNQQRKRAGNGACHALLCVLLLAPRRRRQRPRGVRQRQICTVPGPDSKAPCGYATRMEPCAPGCLPSVRWARSRSEQQRVVTRLSPSHIIDIVVQAPELQLGRVTPQRQGRDATGMPLYSLFLIVR